jgi:5-methylcytosine-specific restriction enzyme subunit McrC
MNVSPIPIENVYYLLCYAWNRLDEGEIVDVSQLPSTSLVDLFARVLTNGVEHLARRGLERVYVPHEEELPGIRGRIDILQTERRLLRKHGRAACIYDELSTNSIPNQIIKATLLTLRRHASLEKRNRDAVMTICRRLQHIEDIQITARLFRRVQLHSNSRYYRFLLNICELIHSSWLVDEKVGSHRFRDFLEDETRMALVFQDFVFNFLRIERSDLKVRRENILWRIDPLHSVDTSLLPTMQTDISIDAGDQHIILDTKFYRSTLTEYRGGKKIHTENLYQLFSYIMNRLPSSLPCEGILLYPTIEEDVCASFPILGHIIQVRTLNLAQSWQKIRADPLNLIPSYAEPHNMAC